MWVKEKQSAKYILLDEVFNITKPEMTILFYTIITRGGGGAHASVTKPRSACFH